MLKFTIRWQRLASFTHALDATMDRLHGLMDDSSGEVLNCSACHSGVLMAEEAKQLFELPLDAKAKFFTCVWTRSNA
ncbi:MULTISPECIES: hypothetical protein [Xanthomonas]|uniref:hypothetical protein n=1 Tax=Xanthomonas TaxID=338 RepID=UPI00160ACF54|nr:MULTISPECIES: hypothetical protein [Xanthomonas]MBB4770922.1 hypothetical protein [Xanthomonas arboricola]